MSSSGALLPCFAIFLRLFGVDCGAIAAIDKAVLRGLLVVQDGAAGFADGYAGFDFFRADRAIVEGLGVIQPRLFQAEQAGGAALQVGDEHGILGAGPLEVGGVDQTAVEGFEALTGVFQLRGSGCIARGYEHAVKTAFAGIAVEFASDVFGDLARGGDGEAFAGLWRANLERAKVRTITGWPFFGGDVYQ